MHPAAVQGLWRLVLSATGDRRRRCAAIYAYALSFVVDCRGEAIERAKSVEEVFAALRIAGADGGNASPAFAEQIQLAALARLHPEGSAAQLVADIAASEDAFWDGPLS